MVKSIPCNLPFPAISAHEKECALAALAYRIEKATGKEKQELKRHYRDTLQTPTIESLNTE